ncbi:MAG: hypothetical protein P8M78_04105 [Myxococcota bacterium]|nr:hypothetical protein [Myxococcota bacterium]
MNNLRTVVSVGIGLAVGLLIAWYFALFPAPSPTGQPAFHQAPTRSKTTVEETLAPSGVAAQVREALLIEDLLVRQAAVAELLLSLGPESLGAVRQGYESVLIDLGDSELVLLGDWWARFDPRAALRWTDHNWPARFSTPVVGAALREWGRVDPTAAMAAAQSAPNERMKLRWSEAVLRGWDEARLNGALEFAETLGHGPTRQWALYTVTRRKVLRDGPDAAIAWAESLPDDDPRFKRHALMRVATATAAVQPEKATALVDRHIDGAYYEDLPRRVAKGWFDHDPDEAFTWLSSLPEGPERDDAVRETFRLWLSFSTPPSLAWVQAQPSAPWVDPAHSVYAGYLAKTTSPEKGMEWTQRIVGEEERHVTQAQVARIWLSVDPERADAWLEKSDLPPDLIKRTRVVPEAMRKYYKHHPPSEMDISKASEN